MVCGSGLHEGASRACFPDARLRVRAEGEWRCGCLVHGWYWTREIHADPLQAGGALEAVERDLLPVIDAVWSLHENTFEDVCMLDRAQDRATMQRAAVAGGQPGPSNAMLRMILCFRWFRV
jgi:hypothetical protein